MPAEPVNALTLYWSAGGNTEKVARVLHQTLEATGARSELREINPDLTIDYYDYNLILLGAPVYRFLPPEAVIEFLGKQQGTVADVQPACPEKPGRYGVVFCTYGGPHTGIREARPALLYMGQFLEHAGIPVVEEMPVVGEFHAESRQEMNLKGRLGDIRGRPNAADLKEVQEKLKGLLRRLHHRLPDDLRHI
jgi:hypothetical protein